MLHYRPFRNTDPPVVTAIWRSCAGQDGLVQPVSVDLFEQLIFGRLYFDRQGLILAWDGDQPVGFVHAGFGPNATRNWTDADTGVVCALVVRPDYRNSDVPAALLAQAEQYLRDRGSRTVYGGGIRPVSPFYLGLYGGAELPGVLRSDSATLDLLFAHGYRELDQTRILRRDLAEFRPLVDRVQLRLRRSMLLQTTIDAPAEDWWEASTTGDFDLTRFDLFARGSEHLLGQTTVRAMDSIGLVGPERTAGLLFLHVDPLHRRQGLGTYLMGEALSELHREGYSTVEAQVTGNDGPGLGLLAKLGFQPVGQGAVLRKEL